MPNKGIGEPGGLSSMGSHRVGHDWTDLAVAAAKKEDETQDKMSQIRRNIENQKRQLGIQMLALAGTDNKITILTTVTEI